MASTREFRKNPTNALKMYSQFFLPMQKFLENQIAKLDLKIDIDQLYPINDAWAYFCHDSITIINRRKNRMKRKDAYDGHLKRPKTAFMWFITDRRADYVKENPNASITDVTKALSKVWATLSKEEHAVYDKMHQDDKDRYAAERQEAYDKVKADSDDLINSKPKKPLNAYLFFLTDDTIKEANKIEHQKVLAEGHNKTLLQFISQKWEKLDPEIKAKYEKRAEEAAEKYFKELAEYNAKCAAAAKSEE
jgi:hypothetical protein